MLKSYFLGVDEQSKTIVDLFKYHEQTAAAVLKPDTLSHYTTTHNYFIEFLESTRNTSDIFLKEIDYKTRVDFDYFLRSNDKLNNNGVMKHFTSLKSVSSVYINDDYQIVGGDLIKYLRKSALSLPTGRCGKKCRISPQMAQI